MYVFEENTVEMTFEETNAHIATLEKERLERETEIAYAIFDNQVITDALNSQGYRGILVKHTVDEYDDGVPMGKRNRRLKVIGVSFGVRPIFDSVNYWSDAS